MAFRRGGRVVGRCDLRSSGRRSAGWGVCVAFGTHVRLGLRPTMPVPSSTVSPMAGRTVAPRVGCTVMPMFGRTWTAVVHSFTWNRNATSLVVGL